ncbi:MAG TPA: Rieske 2Fe-2S domain-containing protein [Capillimicrobium sp.]|nr:Rieske 2Fe-2S domain-containing protein [Capillimicrobium sp.]
MSWPKVLAGWLLTRVLGRARAARELDERRRREARLREQTQRHAAERAHAQRRADLLDRLERGQDEEAARREAAHALEHDHEQIRRRRAEPPPTIEREPVSSPRAEWAVILALLAMATGAVGFMVFYVAYPDTQLLGLCLGLALVFGGVAAATAGKRVVPQEQVAEPYHHHGDPALQQDVRAIVSEGRDGISRRKLIAGAAGVAGASVATAAAFPIASLGPDVGQRIYTTPWRAGRRIVDSRGRRLTTGDVDLGAFVLAFPEGAARDDLGAPIVLLRFDASELSLPPELARYAPEGIVAYSRICTHAGCAVSMFRHPSYPATEPGDALVCPCHFSTFDPRRGGEVLFGPAARALPQLPLRVGAGGELEAAGDFTAPIGPSYGGIRLGDEEL